jgi:hypothetical protein
MNAQYHHYMNLASQHMRDAFRLRRMRTLMRIEIAIAHEYIDAASLLRISQ